MSHACGGVLVPFWVVEATLEFGREKICFTRFGVHLLLVVRLTGEDFYVGRSETLNTLQARPSSDMEYMALYFDDTVQSVMVGWCVLFGPSAT
jgi:hypothetical protein